MKKTLLFLVLIISTVAASAQKNTSESYIEKFKDHAISIMHDTGIPASIILGIAMHESGSGNSAIAKNLNNQFGMKGGSSSIYYKNNKKVRSSYKKYDSVVDSFKDFARIMTEKPKFSHLADNLTNSDYVGWVRGIQHAGYASSRKWGNQVLGLIRKYNLNVFDSSKGDSTQLADNIKK